MSLHSYRRSQIINVEDFDTLIMAAMRNADDENLNKLTYNFPEIYTELKTRYNVPGGKLKEEIENGT